ncbi:DUF4124 domain-containing protein [Shewanella schlegeliana]|uniref:DUF4124 domain-containing protein n=1 Tax=Shewanella schlegeliana TaxID=190308 RepID=A0ABS1T174_9GAMM|nr:DUF4124 domain-containing protein [Shewanella schlegeliana]MBL4914549.1 DUF4124 domain-containing protein [Shewanella schlegeliana]MCL1109635.1 DUF4124 domain-containing protein [Shewanella schlegeliana]GIU30027.1 hypothetical protein TUM4433_20010 [Shewanella schlegeliana]
MRIGLALLLLLAATFAHATIYKWVDEDGTVHFSDKPVKNAEVVELKENTQNNIKLPEVIALPSMQSDTDSEKVKYKVQIVSPTEEESIHNNEGDITIIANIEPQLSSAHELALFMDGQQIGNTQQHGIFKLNNIDRGEHSFVVKVLSKNGKQLASTPVRIVFLHRTTINGPTHVRPQPRGNE